MNDLPELIAALSAAADHIERLERVFRAVEDIAFEVARVAGERPEWQWVQAINGKFANLAAASDARADPTSADR
jgi:hypothetical protein